MNWNPFSKTKPVTPPTVTPVMPDPALMQTGPYSGFYTNGMGYIMSSPTPHTSKREQLLSSIKHEEQRLLKNKEELDKKKVQLAEFEQYDQNLHELLNTILKTHTEAPGAESELKCLKILQNYVDKIAYENQLEKLGNS